MKKLNLSSYGVEEMSQQEMLNVEGGGLLEWAVGCVVAFVAGSIYQAITGENATTTGARVIEEAWSTHIEIMTENPMAFK
jgi:lactobin A/cerein 7B family class IIb bacteriocin